MTELVLRQAQDADVPLLARLNRGLIDDQGHDNPAGPDELAARMRHWLGGVLQVALAEVDGEPVGYAVWRDDPHDGLYIRHLFVVREQRRNGVGRRIVELLLDRWPGREVKLDVLLHNDSALGFWRAMGFADHALVLRRRATTDDEPRFTRITTEDADAVRKPWMDIWVAASNAGGAIDFAAEIGRDDVAHLVDAELKAQAIGSALIGAVLAPDGRPVGIAVVRPGTSAVSAHRGHLARVMVAPAWQDRGVGRQLVTGMHDHARELGLRRLDLGARSGQGLEKFYAGLGYTVMGRYPDAIRIGSGEYRDEILMVIRLDEPAPE